MPLTRYPQQHKRHTPRPSLPHAQALVSMRENFEEINRLCAECQSLIDCHDKIAVLSEVHHNLRKTLQVSERGVAWRGVQQIRVQ